MLDYKARRAEPDYKRKGYEQRRKVVNFLLLNVGTIIVAMGVYFFKYPNNFALGGVSGLSVVISALLPGFSPAKVAFVINVLLLILALLIFGKNFTGKTFYSSLLLSVLLVIFDKMLPMQGPLTDEGILELFIAIMLSAFGGAILFNLEATSGGTDIIAMIIKKFSGADIGKALFISDFFVTVSTFFIFDIRTALLSATGLLLKGLIVDGIIQNFNRKKFFTIITSKPEEIGGYVTNCLKRSCTRIAAVGEYTGEARSVFICAVDLQQAVLLKEAVKEIDESAFIIVNSSSEISGRGFRSGF